MADARCESSLCVGLDFVEPSLTGLEKVRRSLEQDATLLRKKYGGAEPCGRHSRFAVELPSGPQHPKYCQPHRRLSEGSSPTSTEDSEGGSSSSTAPSVKYNLQTLERWFHELDSDGLGVSQRALILSLRRRKSVQGCLLRIRGVSPLEDPADAGRRTATPESHAPSTPETGRPRVPELLDCREISRLAQIFGEVDEGNTGALQWPAFVEFFRRAGLLVECHAHDATSITGTELGPPTVPAAGAPPAEGAAAAPGRQLWARRRSSLRESPGVAPTPLRIHALDDPHRPAERGCGI